MLAVYILAQLFQVFMDFRQVLAIGTLAPEEEHGRGEAHPIHAQVKPEVDHLADFLLYFGVVVVQVCLVAVKTVPVIGFCHIVPFPVGGLVIGKDDLGLFVFFLRITPDVEISF